MAVREMIIADLRRFRDLGALQPSADLLLVLRLFLTDHPEARCVQKRDEPWKKRELATSLVAASSASKQRHKGRDYRAARYGISKADCGCAEALCVCGRH